MDPSSFFHHSTRMPVTTETNYPDLQISMDIEVKLERATEALALVVKIYLWFTVFCSCHLLIY